MYAQSANNPCERTHDRMIKHGEMSLEKKDFVFGVKGASILSRSPAFDMVRVFPRLNACCFTRSCETVCIFMV